jgi:imidazolonepropionase-like amidohydrolase
LTPALAAAMADSSATTALKSLPALHTMLQNGFTTVRDLGCGGVGYLTVDLRDAVAAGLIGAAGAGAPRIVSARGGHGDFSSLLADEYQTAVRPMELGAADGVDEIRTKVRQEGRAGADWVKFAATGGFSSSSDVPIHATYSQEEMTALVATAADVGIPARTVSATEVCVAW